MGHKSNTFLAENTFRFVSSQIKAPARILEAGCGNGCLSRALIEKGYQITAIDVHENAISEAHKIGVPAIQADLLEYHSEEKFDALVCSRSFHHIHPLSSAVEKSAQLLKVGGLLILEDFACELMDEKTALWFFGLLSLMQAQNPQQKMHGPKLANGMIPDEPLQAWRDHHFSKHRVAKAIEMKSAVSQKLQIKYEENVPYLYGYFTEFLNDQSTATLMHWESALAETEQIKQIGWRLIAELRC